MKKERYDFMEENKAKYRRVLLKLSGEALADGADGILNFNFIVKIAEVLKKCRDAGVEISVIVGAGNIWRGRQGRDMNQVRADSMGMLATAINALALQDTFISQGLDAVVMSAVEMPAFADRYIPRHADKALTEGKIVILACGLGSPFFSTDTPAVLRAAELSADVVLLAKNVDGVYSADPKTDPSAVRYDSVTCRQILRQDLKALDLTAAAFSHANGIKSYVFELKDPMNIYRVIMGEKIGTEIAGE